MRILLLIDHLGAGGAQRQASALHQAWLSAGVDAHLAYYYPQHHFRASFSKAASARAVHLDAPGRLARLRAVKAHVKRVDPDVLLSFLPGPSLMAASLKATGLKAHWVASERSAHLAQYSRMRQTAYVGGLRLADHVVPNSHAGQSELLERGLESTRLSVIPNGIALTPEMTEAPILRPHRPVKLLMVGSISRVKNHVRVIEALADKPELNWTLDIVGRTTQPEVHAQLLERIDATGLSSRVQLHGAQQDLEPFYSQAHLMLLPSSFEGFPNVVLEAWAWGCPVLVSDFGDLPELVGHGRRGRVVKLAEPGALAQALSEAIGQPDALMPLARAGRAAVAERYTVASVAQRWLALMEGLRRTPRRRGPFGRVS